jgi:hypothetical protein
MQVAGQVAHDPAGGAGVEGEERLAAGTDDDRPWLLKAVNPDAGCTGAGRSSDEIASRLGRRSCCLQHRQHQPGVATERHAREDTACGSEIKELTLLDWCYAVV